MWKIEAKLIYTEASVFTKDLGNGCGKWEDVAQRT